MTSAASATGAMGDSPWRARLFVSTSEQRLRMPRDLIGGVGGALVACGSWTTIATGIGSAVTLGIPNWIAWLVTLAGIAGTSAFIAVSALLVRCRPSLAAPRPSAGRRRHGRVGLCRRLSRVGAPGWFCTTACSRDLRHGRPRGPNARPPAPYAPVGHRGDRNSGRGLQRSPRAAGHVGRRRIGHLRERVPRLRSGTQDVAPTADEARGFLQQLGVPVKELRRSPMATSWGATRFAGVDAEGLPVDVDVYGRDSPEGQLLARAWRFIWVRRSTLDLRLRRAQHIRALGRDDALGARPGCEHPDGSHCGHGRAERRCHPGDPTARGKDAVRARR